MSKDNNKKTPKVRFPGFNDDWEQRKLGELTTYRNGTGHEEKQSDVGKYELVNLNSISIDGGLKPSGKFIDEETGIISITQGIWKTEFDIINQTFQDGCQTINTTILEVSSNELAVPALMFLNYYQTAEAFIKDETLYCRMTGFTAWETLDVDYNNSLLDIHNTSLQLL